MGVDEIMARVYDVLVMFDLIPYLRAMVIIALATWFLRSLTSR